MTPKDKAQELVEKYQNLLFINITNLNPVYQNEAKQCALIAVDEIINEVPTEVLDTYKGEINFIINERNQYWQEVKQEIEKL